MFLGSLRSLPPLPFAPPRLSSHRADAAAIISRDEADDVTTWVSASISVSFNRGENGKEALTSSRVAGPSEEVPGSGPPITRSSSVGTSTGKSNPNGVAAPRPPVNRASAVSSISFSRMD